MDDPKAFDIDLSGETAHVTDQTIKSSRVFHVIFANGCKPLNITVATGSDDTKFWTSIPEGRKAEAEVAGRAIAAYLREYRRTQACAITTDKKLHAPNLFD